MAGCRKLYTPASANGERKQHFKRSRRHTSNWPSNDTPLLDSHFADKQPIWMTLLFCHNLSVVSEINETKQCEFRLIWIFFKINISFFILELRLMCKSWPIPRRIDSSMPGISSRVEIYSLSFEKRNSVPVNPLHLEILEGRCLSNNTFCKTTFYYTTHFQTVFNGL